MPRKKATSYAPIYYGQSARYQVIGRLENMTIEQLEALQSALTNEFQLREAWLELATAKPERDGDPRTP